MFALWPWLRQPLPICGFGIARDFPKTGVAGDGRDLVRAASRLCQTPCGGLTEAVRAATAQTRFAALTPEPIAEPCDGIRLTPVGEQEGHVARRLSEDRCQRIVHGYPHLAPGLLLSNADRAVVEVLTPYPYYVGAPLARIKQQGERQPRARTNQVAALELLDFGFGPRMITIALAARNPAYIAGGIIRPHADLDGVLHQRPQRTTQFVRRHRRGCSSQKLDHMIPL